MNALLQHMRPLPGRALLRRTGPGYQWGEVVYAPGFLAGTHVTWTHIEATFQKGRSHYLLVMSRDLRSDGYQGILPPIDPDPIEQSEQPPRTNTTGGGPKS